MKAKTFAGLLALGGLTLATAMPVAAQTVKVTPLGSHEGEFCANDRALLFEDPDGTRILYDAGRTVRGPDDPRLGEVDVVLLSHVHGDHLGDRIASEAGAGECGKPEFSESVTPASNTVNIAVGKNAKLVVGSEMASFFGKKIAAAGGDASQAVLVRFGASRKIGGVSITTVPAVHSNGLSHAFLEGDLAKQLSDNGLTVSLGPPTGYVVQFSNGTVAYLSGDTGMTAEQELVVRDHYKANLAVMNIGDVYTTGPKEAAYVVNEMVQPASVIASHANEPATKDGEVQDGTKTKTFMDAANMPVYVPLSGRTMAFDGAGKCVEGCE